MDQKCFIILSGYNMRAIISFMRVFIKLDVPFYIIATTSDDLIFKTSYSDKVVYTREDKDITKFHSILLEVKKRLPYKEVYMLPSTEYLNRHLLDNRVMYEADGIHIPMAEASIYKTLSNKYSFHKLCKDNNIDVPVIYNNKNELVFPCVAKACTYDKYSGKPIIIENKDEYEEFICTYSLNDFFIEEYVDGQSYYLLYYVRKDGSYLSFAQKNLVQQSNGKSILLAESDELYKEKICKDFGDLFVRIGFFGLIMVEVKKHKGLYKMIEANPRPWGPSQLFVDCGVPLIENFLTDIGFDFQYDLDKPFHKGWYFWENGFSDSKREEKYYDYSYKSLLDSYDFLVKYDVYNREDTKMIYELGE